MVGDPVKRKDVDLDSQDFRGMMALMYAVALDYQPIVSTLVEAGVDLCVTGIRSRSVLRWVCMFGSVDTFDMILEAARKAELDFYYYTMAIQAAVTTNRPIHLNIILEVKGMNSMGASADGWTQSLSATTDYWITLRLDRHLRYLRFTSAITGEPAMKPPTQWHTADYPLNLAIQDEGLTVQVIEPLNPFEDHTPVSAVLAVNPMPLKDCEYWYFEVKVCEVQWRSKISIGFCEEHFELNSMIGETVVPYGYRGEGGMMRFDRELEPKEANQR
ncbi:hypothetical protein K458DRAFT_394854 [Lentithecium fluviatile CBS 122367]|uniref:Uncharacterized protein n=1 Tax=Lentithecium fluviatile CBS 122367 TaxID=1168545 RepID=A0A6G1IKA0_9PLEO|nr:hypothetical protein K458DRAFT_394854 [Lentithecium fluviatile CBS 122367]